MAKRDTKSQLFNKVPDRKPVLRRVRGAVILGKMLRVCPGGRHAWFESNAGHIVRKPI